MKGEAKKLIDTIVNKRLPRCSCLNKAGYQMFLTSMLASSSSLSIVILTFTAAL